MENELFEWLCHAWADNVAADSWTVKVKADEITLKIGTDF
jgi:hypothetical protein